MAESVHLPNTVSCSDQRKRMQPVLGQSKRITAEYKGVKTATTRRSTSSTVEQVGIKNVDHVVVSAKTVAENGTTLKIFKMICIGVALSTVISTATFGGIIFNLVS